MFARENRNLVLAVYFITFIFGLPANIIALYTFIKKVQRDATPVDVLLIGLPISDLLFLVFLPFWMKGAIDHMQWYLPNFLCSLSGLIFYGTIYNSTLYLTAISVERYLGVAYPIKYKLKRKPLYAVVGSVFIWVISMTECSIVYIMQYYHKDNETTDVNNSTVCYQELTSKRLEILLPFRLQLFVLLFCLPLLICCFCYINFIRILSRLPNICPWRRYRSIGLAFSTIVVFVVCFGPHNVGYINGESTIWRRHAVLTSIFNTFLDPFIYYFSSSEMRATFNGILSRVSARLQLQCCSSRGCQSTDPCLALELRTQSTG